MQLNKLELAARSIVALTEHLRPDDRLGIVLFDDDAVHSATEFRQRLADEFDFLVTPMLFDLSLSLESSGFTIERVYGSPEANLATGELMRVNTLFPSRSINGEAKGGLILLKLGQTGNSSEIRLKVGYADRKGESFTHEARVAFPTGCPELFDNSGIRKCILLARYGEMLKSWLGRENASRQADVVRERREAGLGIWERPSQPLPVTGDWKSRIDAFLGHFRGEQSVLGDPILMQEVRVLEMMSHRSTGG